MPAGGPLAGLTILDLTRLLPGGYCTLLLRDLGADVIKVEEPGQGDAIRWAPPVADGVSAAHRALNRGKRSVTLNLKAPDGPAVLRRLCLQADALVEGFRPGVMDRLGVGWDVLSEANPRLVYVAVTGFGQDGPYRDLVGHDINYVGYGGVLSMTGPPDGGPPVPPGVQVGDLSGGMLAAIGLLAALLDARSTGRGRFVDVSLLDGVVSWLSIHAGSYLANGVLPAPGVAPLGQGLACYRVYRTGDGRYLAVGALELRFWERLCAELGCAELAPLQYEPERQSEIAERIGSILETDSRDGWLERLRGLEVCVGPVNDVGEALRDPQVRHRGMVADVNGVAVGPGPAIGVSGAEPGPFHPAPGLGEHTEEVLRGSGFGRDEIESLRERGVI